MLSRILLIVATCAGLMLAQPNELNLRQDPPAAIQSNQVNAVYTGTAGGTTYYYWVVTRYPIGYAVPVSPVVVARAASSLGGGNSVALTWPAMAGASSYDVLRTSTPAAPSSCTCAVTLATTSTTVTDSGGALSAWPPAGLHAAGSATMVLQLNNRDGGAPYIEMAVQNAQRVLNYQLGLLKNGPAPSYVPSGFIQTYANQYGRLACVDSSGADCLNNIANVLNFGCVGDGVSDDTVCIQSAINAQSTTRGGAVFFPTGEYRITSSIVPKSNVLLFGENASVTATAPEPTSYIVTSNNIAMFRSTENTNGVAFQDLGFRGGGGAGSIGIRLANAANKPRIQGCFFDNFGDQAILIEGGLHADVQNVFVQNSLLVRAGRSGYIGTVDVSNTDCVLNNVVATASVADNTGQIGDGYIAGIAVRGSSCSIAQSEGHLSQVGIYLNGVALRVTGNVADLNQGYGFVSDCFHCSIVGNMAYRNSRTANNAYAGILANGQGAVYASNLSVGLNADAVKMSYFATDTNNGIANTYSNNYASYLVASSPAVNFTGSSLRQQSYWDNGGYFSIDPATRTYGAVTILSRNGLPNQNKFQWFVNTDGASYSQLVGRVVNDAESASATFMQVYGSGTAIDYVSIPTLIAPASKTFADLGSPGNGVFQFCSDCTKATPCAGGGTGAFAYRVNNAWDCNP